MSATTLDRLLDGQVQLRQSANGYRAGMDAVLLAAALEARPGEHLVEFGCGPGAALLCAAAHLMDAEFTGVEVDPVAASMARENAGLNRAQDRVTILEAEVGDVELDRPADQVFFNPPFFDDPSSLRAPKPEKQRAWMSGATPLPVWVQSAARNLKAKGRLTLIHRADALADILSALVKSFGSVVVKPVAPKADRAAKRVIVTARIGGRAPLVLLPPLVLHDESEGIHTREADAILRGRAVISLG